MKKTFLKNLSKNEIEMMQSFWGGNAVYKTLFAPFYLYFSFD